METNQAPITLRERAVDYDRLCSVLHEWGYRKGEIQRLLKEVGAEPQLTKRTSKNEVTHEPGDLFRCPASHPRTRHDEAHSRCKGKFASIAKQIPTNSSRSSRQWAPDPDHSNPSRSIPSLPFLKTLG